jgi:hypothetical protein
MFDYWSGMNKESSCPFIGNIDRQFTPANLSEFMAYFKALFLHFIFS